MKSFFKMHIYITKKDVLSPNNLYMWLYVEMLIVSLHSMTTLPLSYLHTHKLTGLYFPYLYVT